MGDELERVNMDEIEAEDAKALPNKEVMSLLDINANVDLGLDLAAPVDLAVAANLNVAAPIEAAAAANVLSPDGQALAAAQQHGSIDQGISGSADATAPQHADVSQNSNPEVGGGATADTGAAGATADTAPADGTAATPGDAAAATPPDSLPAPGDAVPAPGDAVPAPGDAVPAPGDAVPYPGDVTGGVGSFLQGGSLLDANVDIHANANLAAPIDGAVAANANVAAPIDAAVAANVGSDHGVAEALAPQEVDIHQNLDDVEANATAQQDADVQQQ
jgi:hypothetical protein